MNRIRFSLACAVTACIGCGAGTNLSTPSESDFLAKLDLPRVVQAIAPEGMKLPQSQHASSGAASPGRGKWKRHGVYQVSGNTGAQRQLLKSLRETLTSHAQRSGATVESESETLSATDQAAFRFRYVFGANHGTVDVSLQPPLEGTGGAPTDRELRIEMIETADLASRD